MTLKLATAIEPLFIDTSSWSPITPNGYGELVAVGSPWHGAIAKATEGAGRSGHAWEARLASWFRAHWPAICGAGGDRYGADWFRGAYHFLICNGHGREQAEHFLRTIAAAGGWGVGDLLPIVDVEEGSRNARRAAALGPSVVIDTTEEFVATIKREIGRDVILYAGWWLHSLGLRSRMGCDWLWYAAYSARLQRSTYERIGWSADRLLLWQYDGSGDHNGVLRGYPVVAPMRYGESVDINVLTLRGGLPQLRGALQAKCSEARGQSR